jgi:hypothetical protein
VAVAVAAVLPAPRSRSRSVTVAARRSDRRFCRLALDDLDGDQRELAAVVTSPDSPDLVADLTTPSMLPDPGAAVELADLGDA